MVCTLMAAGVTADLKQLQLAACDMRTYSQQILHTKLHAAIVSIDSESAILLMKTDEVHSLIRINYEYSN